MWSYQDLWIIKAHFVASCLSVLPKAGINSSTIRAAFSKENKRSWKSSWASSVQKTTHKGTGKDEAGRFLWLNQLVTSTSWKHSIVGEFFVLPFSFKSPVSLVRRKYHPGVRIWEAENGFYSYWESQTMPVLTNWKKKKRNEEAGICVRHPVNDTLLIKLIPSLNNSESHKSLSPLNRKAWMN